MERKAFDRLNRIAAAAVFTISLATYLLTIEPTASFWDCGEFIASSYKLEVGHPPGNPVYQLIARAACLFADKMHVAAAVNSLSAICSALTVMLLYLTLVFFINRLIPSNAWAIITSSAVGALAFCFSDTFWFSSVEAEVYAMSSLFTALVFWAMIRWYEEADSPSANRWIVLISFLMGLSIGVHLLNLLSIPAIVFLYFYRIREKEKYSFKQLTGIFLFSCVILAVLLFGIIPYLPKCAAYTDLFFVNVLHLPFNSGAVFFIVALLTLCFIGLFSTLKKGKVLANTVLLCITVIIIGFSVFTIVVIRSSIKTPTNENQPDNPFTLVRYLSREQYGDTPLIYGEYFGAPYDISYDNYYTPSGDRYIKTETPPKPIYHRDGKMLFPRMWDNSRSEYTDFYLSYIGEQGIKVKGSDYPKPTFLQNLTFFFDYQINWMYWRYFMWNFAGRQNDIHGQLPGDPIRGNWECGIPFIDRLRTADMTDAPEHLKNNRARNHYYMLPLLLGIAGLLFQYRRDRRGCWLIFLMFFMTGIAIVIYLNQQPLQVRERDYAYAGSFYFFSAWIGIGAASLFDIISRKSTRYALVSTITCMGVPVLMAMENWDDHDRSNRYTAAEMARNILNSAGKDGILVTLGDNDTFPVWYAQEVEEVRTDVRVVNTSLLGMDWHIDQMKYAVNESAPLKLSVGHNQYLYGTNDYTLIYDTHDSAFLLSDVMKVFRHPDAKIMLTDGSHVDYIPSRRLIVPVNKDNVLKYGILDRKYSDLIPDHIVLTIPQDKNGLTKPELFFLDLLSGYEWDRPISFLSAGGDLDIGIKDYLMYDGFSYRFVPIRNKTNIGSNDFIDPDDLYDRIKNTYRWEAFKRTDWNADYQNLYGFCGLYNLRRIFIEGINAMLSIGDKDRARELLEMCQECVPCENFPLDLTGYGFSNEKQVTFMIEAYYETGEAAKGRELAETFSDSLIKSASFLMKYDSWMRMELESCISCLSYLVTMLNKYDDSDLAQDIIDRFNNSCYI